MRICLVLEGCYPYVHGGVSTWMHGYIQAMPEHEFVLWVIGAHAADRGKFVYELPGNVVEVREVFLDDALRLSGEQHEASFNDREREALRRLVSLSNPDWDVLFDIFHRRRVHPLSFLQSRTFMDIFRDVCLAEYPYTPFADAFHTMRSMLLPVLYLLGSEVPVADVYHAISTGYGGLLACLGSSVHHAPVLLTEHGIYTREREEEIIRADWVVPSFKDRWIRFFYLLSEEIYRRAFRVTSLFHNARKTQIDMGCDAGKCLVIPNGIQFDRFKDIPLKPDDGWVDIGAVVRLAPIKDVKTMIYAFFELHERLPKNAPAHYGRRGRRGVRRRVSRAGRYPGRARLDLYRPRQRGRVHGKARLYHFDEHLRGPAAQRAGVACSAPSLRDDRGGLLPRVARRRPGRRLWRGGFCDAAHVSQGLGRCHGAHVREPRPSH